MTPKQDMHSRKAYTIIGVTLDTEHPDKDLTCAFI